MFEDVLLEKMSDEQIGMRINKINRLADYYSYMGYSDVAEKLEMQLEACYNVLDERAYLKEIKEEDLRTKKRYGDKNIIFDTEERVEEKKNAKQKGTWKDRSIGSRL